MKKVLLIGAVLAACAITAPATAALLVNTGTPQPNVGGVGLFGTQSLAGYFTLGANSTINAVEGYMNGSVIPSAVTVNLYSDGPVPSTILFSSTFNLSPGTSNWLGVFGQNWQLSAGSYWVGFLTNGVTSMPNVGTPNPLSKYAATSMFAGGAWVPNQTSNLGIRIGGTTVAAAVPEPATWFSMIVGFGLVGSTVRKRRTAFIERTA
jgi:hypothetical protein